MAKSLRTRRDDVWDNTWYIEESVKNTSDLRDMQKQQHDAKNLWLQLTREFGSWDVISVSFSALT